jgi:HSP20 family protein
MTVRFRQNPIFALPFGDLSAFEREVDGLFGSVLGEAGPAAGGFSPRFDVSSTEDSLVVVGELPGLKKEDLKITVHDGVLTVAGERKAPALPEDAAWLRTETVHGRFSRSFVLPYPVESGAVDASLVDGLLTIVLPKAAEARPRSIAIR